MADVSVKEACSLLAAVGGGWPLPSLCHLSWLGGDKEFGD